MSSRLETRPARFLADETVDADVVVIGSGVAGLATALDLQPRRVTILTKTWLGGGASRWAQGGVAAALGPGDAPALHSADTLAAGAGLCDPTRVDALTSAGPAALRRLMARGASFDRHESGRLLLGREGAHGRRRILHANGDATGAEMVRALVAAVRAAPQVRIYEQAFAHDLVRAEGAVVGVLARHGARTVLHRAPAVVLASGGCGQLYRYTTNPPEATGDGLAMAARAGARLADLEMVQFHPTALAVGLDPLPLLTEALRGEGAELVDEHGQRFMVEEHELAELAPRDIVARAIWRQQQAGHTVYLDARQAVGADFPRRFPTVFDHCRRGGIDPRQAAMPVTPAAHYAMAGIATDGEGRASLPGLWACGEVAASGVHGANRLASNSLLEALVFGARVAASIAGAPPLSPRGVERGTVRREIGGRDGADATPIRNALRQLMWEHAGLVRNGTGLAAALEQLESLAARLPATPGETANLLTVGRLVAAAALAREESRGAHYRSDFPASDPAWQQRLMWTYAPGDGAFPLQPATTIARPSRVREIA